MEDKGYNSDEERLKEIEWFQEKLLILDQILHELHEVEGNGFSTSNARSEVLAVIATYEREQKEFIDALSVGHSFKQ